MMTMTIERVRAFNGLDVLVARDEGLFAGEGLVSTSCPAPRTNGSSRLAERPSAW